MVVMEKYFTLFTVSLIAFEICLIAGFSSAHAMEGSDETNHHQIVQRGPHQKDPAANPMINLTKEEGEQLATRLSTYNTIAPELALLNDEALSELLEKATPLHSGIGGTTALVEICGTPIFVENPPN